MTAHELIRGQGLSLSAQAASDHRAEYRITVRGRTYEIYFASRDTLIRPAAEAAALCVAAPAMRTCPELSCRAALSATFTANLRAFTEHFSRWYPEDYRPVSLRPDQAITPPQRSGKGRTGTLFTGGVDSFYTLLKHRSEITDLIYVHGYDVKLDDTERRETVSRMLRHVAAQAGINVIEIETNAIRFFRDFGHWGRQTHGLAVAAAARHLSELVTTIYVPSSFPDGQTHPWGSHPDTDILFSDERQRFMHDGTEASRTDKIRILAGADLALQNLRVCWKNVAGAYNCGHCEKCLRTMTTLYAFGALDRSRTFPTRIAPPLVEDVIAADDVSQYFIRENLRVLQERGLLDDPVTRAWEKVLQRSRFMNRAMLAARKVKSAFWERIAA